MGDRPYRLVVHILPPQYDVFKKLKFRIEKQSLLLRPDEV